jgi:H+/Cl- antiporter ClcA
VFLSGIAVKDYFSVRTLIAKIVGLTLAIGSGLLVGKEFWVRTSGCWTVWMAILGSA